MAGMKLIVFAVEQGQCVFIRTPDNYGILIDCGRSSSGESASPAKWLAENEAPSLKPVGNQAIASPETELPADSGATMRRFSLSREEAEELGGDTQQIINNRSIVTIISYRSAEGYDWKVVVAGDNQTDGLQALLAKPEFSTAIAGADFFVTPYHGQESGFNAGLFEAMGKPLANISCTQADKRVDSRYKKLAQGVKFPDGSRKHFETHLDGNITVEMQDDGKYDVWLFTPKS